MQDSPHKAADAIQERLADYASGIEYGQLSPQAIDAAKARIIDTLGVLAGGFFGAPCRMARALAPRVDDGSGATVIGTRAQTTLDMAAFANGVAARQAEMNDIYHKPGSRIGHPSDVIMPILAAAEFSQVSGREFIAGVVLGYEVYQSIADIFHNQGFDHTNLGCLGAAVAAGKMLRLTRGQLAHCIAMAAVPNNMLRQVRDGHLTMWKVVAAGQAGRAGVFAAMLARAGMQGPHLPFEGKAGWCDHIARQRGQLSVLGGGGVPFRILDTRIKHRPASGATMASILAAEKVAPLRDADISGVEKILVEVFQLAKDWGAADSHYWNPDCREAADHSIPYLTAATLVYGTVTHRSFDDAHLFDSRVRALMGKVEVVVNDSYTRAYESWPVRHHMRTTVTLREGGPLVGETGGGADDLDSERSGAQIEDKFRVFAEDMLGAQRTRDVLDQLWNLERVPNVAAIPAQFILV